MKDFDLVGLQMKQRLLLGILLLFSVYSIQADELIYTPVNPAFGGSAINGSWLIKNAEVQNDYDDPDDQPAADKSSIEIFTDSLERLVLSRLATNAVSQFFDENDGFAAGSYTIGDYEIDITDVDNLLTITTTDTTSGDSTQIVIDQSEY